MNFEQRKQAAQTLVVSYLNNFVPPRGFDDDQLANRVVAIADAFARHMPTRGDFHEAVQRVFTNISDTHLSNTWPPQAAFVIAMPKGQAMGKPAAESFKVEDPVTHYSEMMRIGEHVPETALWGVIANQLPRIELERYRSAAVMNWVSTHKHNAHALMRAKYGYQVDAYFAVEAAE